MATIPKDYGTGGIFGGIRALSKRFPPIGLILRDIADDLAALSGATAPSYVSPVAAAVAATAPVAATSPLCSSEAVADSAPTAVADAVGDVGSGALANDLKAKYNQAVGLLNNQKTQYNIAVTQLNEVFAKYNVAVTAIGELRTIITALRVEVAELKSKTAAEGGSVVLKTVKG